MKRFIKSKLILSFAAFIMIAAAIAIPFSGSIVHSHAQGSQSQSTKTVTVQFPVLQANWDTGIDLPGGQVTFAASGDAAVTFGEGTGKPSGDPWCIAENQPDAEPPIIFPMPGKTCNALVGKVGFNGSYFFIGSGGIFSLPAGRVFLTINQYTTRYNDPNGHWTVSVTFQTPTPVPTPPPLQLVGVPTNASCSHPTVVTLIRNADTVITGTAMLTTTDPGGSASETKAGHFLFLKEKFGPFQMTIKDFNKSVPFKFTTAENQDQLTACILAGTDKKGPDGDEKGVVTIISPTTHGLEKLAGFITLLGEVGSCSLDFFGVIAPLKKIEDLYKVGKIQHITELLDIYRAFLEIAKGKSNVAAIYFQGARLIPFESCVEGIVDLLVPQQKAALEECLTGTTDVDMTCRTLLAQRVREILPPFIVF